MWDTKCQCGDNCTCKNCGDWSCGCCQTDDTVTTWAAYGTGDVQDIQFTAEDIAKLNDMFWEMDLSSDGDDEWNIEVLEKNLEWMKEKFGNNNK